MMSAAQRLAVVLALLGLAAAAWMFRYEIVPVARGADGQLAAAYVLDRWTGRVELVYAVSRREVVPAQVGQ